MLAHWIDGVRSDLGHVIASFKRRSGVAAAGIAIVALGVAANTAIFSILYPVLLRPLPFPGADRLVWVTTPVPALDAEFVGGPDFLDWQEHNRTLAGLGAYDITFVNMATGDAARRLRVAKVSDGFFSTLDLQPVTGRAFAQGDFTGAAPRVVILSEALWRSQFNGSRDVIGRAVSLDNEIATIVGIMPSAVQVVTTAEAWEPLPLNRATEQRDGRMTFLNVVGRLRDGVSVEQASADLQTIRAASVAPTPTIEASFRMTPLHEELVKDSRMTLLMLQLAVILLLIITAANLGTLQLVRASTRLREFAVRLAVGSSRAALARLVLIENTLIAVMGGAAGIGAGLAVVVPLLGLLPIGSMAGLDTGPDWRVIAFASALTLAVACVASFAPLMLLRETRLAHRIREAERGDDRGNYRFRTTLTVGQFVLVLALIVGATLATRTLQELQQVRLGFDPRSLQTLTVTLTPAQYPDVQAQRRFFDTVLERVRGLSGVETAAVTTSLPLTGFGTRGQFYREDRQWDDADPVVGRRAVSPTYFETMQIPLVRGRTFTDLDHAEAPRVVIINETMARLYFADRDPIGLRINEGGRAPWMTIVGIVADVRQIGIDQDLRPEMFIPHRQYRTLRAMSLVVRTGDDSTPVAAIEATVRNVDSTQPVHDVRTMEEALSDALRPWRSRMLLIGALAAIALGLAGAGLYALMGYVVSVRRKEFGVRMALGADRQRITRIVFAFSARLVLVSLPLGLALAYAFARGMSTLVFGIEVFDLSSFVVAAATLSVVAIVAASGPAYRAATVDPSTLLRLS